MRRRKPDLLLVLIVLFGLGFIATNCSYAFWSGRVAHAAAKEYAGFLGIETLSAL